VKDIHSFNPMFAERPTRGRSRDKSTIVVKNSKGIKTIHVYSDEKLHDHIVELHSVEMQTEDLATRGLKELFATMQDESIIVTDVITYVDDHCEEEMPDDVGSLLDKMLDLRHVPRLLQSLHMRLIGKEASDGSYKGERAVGLFSSVVRVFLRAVRRGFGAAWLRAIVPNNWYGTERRAPERAVWVHSMAAAFARHKERGSAAALFDIAKAFDNLRWGHIVRAAKKRNFPDNLLAFLYHKERLSLKVPLWMR
jgi:hypothetical protein